MGHLFLNINAGNQTIRQRATSLRPPPPPNSVPPPPPPRRPTPPPRFLPPRPPRAADRQIRTAKGSIWIGWPSSSPGTPARSDPDRPCGGIWGGFVVDFGYGWWSFYDDKGVSRTGLCPDPRVPGSYLCAILVGVACSPRADISGRAFQLSPERSFHA